MLIDRLAAQPLAPAVDTSVDTTRLALERTRMAYVRTVMAAVRTAASLITFGFAIYELLPTGGSHTGLVGPQEFGILVIWVGLLSLLLAAIQYRREIAALRRWYPDMPRAMAPVMALAIAVLGIVALIMALLGL